MNKNMPTVLFKNGNTLNSWNIYISKGSKETLTAFFYQLGDLQFEWEI